jgi:hypothetical protein
MPGGDVRGHQPQNLSETHRVQFFISDEARRVAIAREIFPRNPAGQTGLADPRELIFTLLADVGPDLSLKPDEMAEEFVITTL